MEVFKYIRSLRAVDELVASNYPLWGIELSRETPNMLVFLFKNSEELENELLDYENVEESRDVGQPPRGVIDKLIELYIGNNTTHLIQFPHGKYSPKLYVFSYDRLEVINKLLINHIKGGITYAGSTGGMPRKFITFDVDSFTNHASRRVTQKLSDTLETEYGVNRKDIHVSYSGSKGYHVELFFSEQIDDEHLRGFYRSVLDRSGLFPEGGITTTLESAFRPAYRVRVEYIPSSIVGVKLPLGIQQKTGKRCWFVDNETMELLEDDDSFNYLLKIKPISPKIIIDSQADDKAGAR